MQKKRLDHLSGWSARAHSEQWHLLARNERIVEQYGANPMETMRRIPSWWFSDITSRVAPCPVVIACDDGDGDEMELWLTKSKSANVTKANLIQKYAGLEGIIRQFKKYHDMGRDADEPCDFQTLESTFSDIMAKSHARQISLGLKPDVPTAVSRGWFSDMKIKIGIKDSAVASAEVRRLTITDEKVFWDGYKEKAIKHNIQITNVFSFDEFSVFFLQDAQESANFS